MDFIKNNKTLCCVVLVPFLFATFLFWYLWIYTPSIYDLDIEKIKQFSINNIETVEDRVNSIEGAEKTDWISGEFFPCAIVELKGSKKVELCFVIFNGVLYAKNEDTVRYFPELEISHKTMH